MDLSEGSDNALARTTQSGLVHVLNETDAKLIERLMTRRETYVSREFCLQQFADQALEDPLGLRRLELEVLGELKREDPTVRAYHLMHSYLDIHARLEGARFSANGTRLSPNQGDYAEALATFVFDGDYIITGAKWDSERLYVNKSSPFLKYLLGACKRIGIDKIDSQESVLREIYNLVGEEFKMRRSPLLLGTSSEERRISGENPYRDQSIALQLGIQEAGIECSLMVGRVHTCKIFWVEAHINTGVYSCNPSLRMFELKKDDNAEVLKVWRKIDPHFTFGFDAGSSLQKHDPK